MWPAFPAADYYGRSASDRGIGIALPWHPSIAFPSSHVGLKHTGEAAGRNLYPCVPQVVVDAELQRRAEPGTRVADLPIPLPIGNRPVYLACLSPQAAG